MRLSFRSGGPVEVGPEEARYQRYMSFSPMLFIWVRVEWKARRVGRSEGKAARSAVRRAGREWIVPRRVMRRPFWSGRGRLVECRGKGKGGRTLVQKAVELELLDPFGGCFGCHLQRFLQTLLSYFCSTSFV